VREVDVDHLLVETSLPLQQVLAAAR